MATQSTEAGAVAAYLGYEYQLLVSVWVSLELIVSRGYCDSIEVEPTSQEDIAADLAVPAEVAEATVSLAAADGPVQIQVKRRSSTWEPGEFRDLIETPAKKGPRGPPPRARALTRMEAAPQLRYLLITDAEVHRDLKAFVVDSISSHSRATKVPGLSVPPETACRIGVLEKRVERHVQSDIDDLLEQSARVPLQYVEECRVALVEQVRQRLLGKLPSQLHRSELEALITRHGGLPPSVNDEFVPPTSFPDLMRRLEAPPFALILVGPPGIGKTWAADKLIEAHRHAARPFQVIANPKPYEVREKLRAPGRTLFYFEDPWGKYRLAEDAESWTEELPRLIRDANNHPDKRFLITSRTGLLTEGLQRAEGNASSARLKHALEPFIVRMRESDFSPQSRREILRRWMRSAARWQRDWVEDHASDIVSHLTVPHSLSIFANAVKKRSRASEPPNLSLVLQESQVDAIGGVVARTVRTLGAMKPAVAIWAFLSTGEPLSEDLFRQLSVWLEEDEHLEADIPGLVQHLGANGWVTWKKEGVLGAHPTVIDALEHLVDSEPSTSERVLRALLKVLVGHEELERVTRLMLGLHGRNLPVPKPVRDAIDNRLREEVLTADDSRFTSAVSNLARLSTARDPLSLIVRAMAAQHPRLSFEFKDWTPPDWTQAEQHATRGSAQAEQLVRRYIRLGLDELRFWSGEERFLDFLWSFGWDLSGDFTAAALEALERGHPHAETLLRGALKAPTPSYERLLAAALEAHDAVEHWWKQEGRETQRHVEEGELDAVLSARILDEPAERFEGPTQALDLLVASRREREQYDWLVRYPRRSDLIEAWAKAIPYNVGDSARDELLALYASAGDEGRAYAWIAIGRACCGQLKDFTLAALASAPVSQLHWVWTALFGLFSAEKLSAAVTPTLQSVPWPRRAAVAFAVREADVPDRGDNRHREPKPHRDAAIGVLGPLERRAIDACLAALKSDEAVSKLRLDSATVDALAELIEGEDELLCAIGCVILASFQRPVASTLQRLIASPDKWVRLHSLRAIRILAPLDRAVVSRFLEDPYYQCRRFAMRLLAVDASPEERKSIIAKSAEPSAPIREVCARIIGKQRWEEGLETLCSLLSDTRSRSEGGLDEEDIPNFHVARSAARALQRFPTPLPELVRNVLLDFLRRGVQASADLAVHHQLIGVISQERDRRVPELIQQLLHSGHRMGGEKEGTFPLRYAAAWGWVEYLGRYPEDVTLIPLSELAEAAGHTDGRLAAPALVALGMLSQHSVQELQRVLAGDEMTDERAVLIDVGARLAGVPVPEDLLAQRVPGAAPARRLVAACFEHDPEPEAWARVARDEAVQAWLERVRTKTPVHAALRKLLQKSPQGNRLSGIPTEDFRAGELADSPRVITTFFLAGLE